MSRFALFAAAATAFAGAAMAASGAMALPEPWGVGFQDAATPVMEEIKEFHDLLLIIITAITLFVLALLIYVCARFRETANPTPSRTTHNTFVEVVWTVVPVLILIVIAIPSFRLLYHQDELPSDIGLTLKVKGHQWFWSYEYPEYGITDGFESYLIPEDKIQPGQHRQLEVDNPVVVPADTNVQVLVTAVDVIHNWAMPAFGIKMDAVPGRVNETWFRVPGEKIGTYYGQCSELCGKDHGYMPIAVKVVSKEDFDIWIEEARERYARNDDSNVQVAGGAPE